MRLFVGETDSISLAMLSWGTPTAPPTLLGSSKSPYVLMANQNSLLLPHLGGKAHTGLAQPSRKPHSPRRFQLRFVQ